VRAELIHGVAPCLRQPATFIRSNLTEKFPEDRSMSNIHARAGCVELRIGNKMMSAHNECVEYRRLQRAYDDAIILWEQERHSNVQAINRGNVTAEEAEKLRNQALIKRNIAANELYIHLKTCPNCRYPKKMRPAKK